MRIAIRTRRDTGEIYVLERGDTGNSGIGDPAQGSEKRHVEHLVETKALQAIRDGLHPRMRGRGTGQFNMIAPSNIDIIEVPT